jgi:hypothetical protein
LVEIDIFDHHADAISGLDPIIVEVMIRTALGNGNFRIKVVLQPFLP